MRVVLIGSVWPGFWASGAWDVGLTRTILDPVLSSLLSVKKASKLRLRGSEPLVAQTGQRPWLRRGWVILPATVGYYSKTN